MKRHAIEQELNLMPALGKSPNKWQAGVITCIIVNVSMVVSFIDGLKNANRSMSCVHDISRILDHVNITLVRLPSSFSGLTSQTDSIQETIDKALNKTDKIVEQLNDLNSSLSNLPNFTKTIHQIKDLKNESGAFNDLNITELIASLQKVENSTNID